MRMLEICFDRSAWRHCSSGASLSSQPLHSNQPVRALEVDLTQMHTAGRMAPWRDCFRPNKEGRSSTGSRRPSPSTKSRVHRRHLPPNDEPGPHDQPVAMFLSLLTSCCCDSRCQHDCPCRCQAMLYATGMSEEDMNKAQIGISSIW